MTVVLGRRRSRIGGLCRHVRFWKDDASSVAVSLAIRNKLGKTGAGKKTTTTTSGVNTHSSFLGEDKTLVVSSTHFARIPLT